MYEESTESIYVNCKDSVSNICTLESNGILCQNHSTCSEQNNLRGYSHVRHSMGVHEAKMLLCKICVHIMDFRNCISQRHTGRDNTDGTLKINNLAS